MDRDPSICSAIEGLIIEPLTIKKDARGAVMHMLRCDSPLYERFGEVYFSVVKPGIIKGWKRHHFMTQHYAVPVGEIQLVVYDDRDDSPSQGKLELIRIGINNYRLVKIPPMIWYGFKGISSEDAMIVNCASHPHDSNEVESRDVMEPPHPDMLAMISIKA